MTMGKNPAFQFYPNDWSRDMEEHPLEIEGSWVRICCKLWYSETRGRLTKTVEQWGRILREPEEETIRILSYLKNEKIGNISDDFTHCNDLVTVVSRRMVRDEKEREMTRLRVERFREKKTGNAPVTPMKQRSSSSSSCTKVHKGKKLPSQKTPDEPKKRFAEFVDLTESQHSTLIQKFGENGTSDRIENLSLYIGKIGEKEAAKKYKSHYHTILAFEKMDQKRKRDLGETKAQPRPKCYEEAPKPEERQWSGPVPDSVKKLIKKIGG